MRKGIIMSVRLLPAPPSSTRAVPVSAAVEGTVRSVRAATQPQPNVKDGLDNSLSGWQCPRGVFEPTQAPSTDQQKPEWRKATSR